MTSKFQSRLIGTVILVAICVIFLPDIFDGKKPVDQTAFASIPLQPSVDTKTASLVSINGDKVDDASMGSLPKDPVQVDMNTVNAAKKTASDPGVVAPDVKKGTDGVSTAIEKNSTSSSPALATVPITALKVATKTSLQKEDLSKPTSASVTNNTTVESTVKAPVVSEEKSSPFDVLKGGWVIQLGSFRQGVNATNLVAKLKKAGYQAHTVPNNPQKGEIVKVIVGPNLSKFEMTKELESLFKMTGLKGQLQKFDPLNP